MSTDDLILERLARIEEKLDRVAAVEEQLDDLYPVLGTASPIWAGIWAC